MSARINQLVRTLQPLRAVLKDTPRVAQVTYKSPWNSTPSFFRSLHTNKALSKKEAVAKLPNILPSVKKIALEVQKAYPEETDLSKTALVFDTHAYPSNLAWVYKILCRQYQLKPENVFCAFRAYSTPPTALKIANALEFHTHVADRKRMRSPLDLDQSHNLAIEQLIDNMRAHLKTAEIERVLVVGDGARFALSPFANTLSVPVDILEQTAYGIKRINENGLSRVLDFSGSCFKGDGESPLIAKDVVEAAIAKALDTGFISDTEDLSNKTVCIAGNGRLGTEIVRYLQALPNPPHLTVYDANPKAFRDVSIIESTVKRCENLEPAMTSADIVIGCSGGSIMENYGCDRFRKFFARADHNMLFISASSGTIEWEIPLVLYRTLVSRDDDLSVLTTDATADVTMLNKRQTAFTIASGGTPINHAYSTRTDQETLEYAEYLRAGLLTATLQLIVAPPRLAPVSRESASPELGIMFDPKLQAATFNAVLTDCPGIVSDMPGRISPSRAKRLSKASTTQKNSNGQPGAPISKLDFSKTNQRLSTPKPSQSIHTSMAKTSLVAIGDSGIFSTPKKETAEKGTFMKVPAIL